LAASLLREELREPPLLATASELESQLKDDP
jgi:hypothetical protein